MKTLGVDGLIEHTTTRLKGVLPNPNLIKVLSYRHSISTTILVKTTFPQEQHAEAKELMASIRYSRNSIRQNNTNNILARMHKCDGHRIDDMVEKT